MQGCKLLVLLHSALAGVSLKDICETTYDSAQNLPIPITGDDSLTDGILLIQTGTLYNLRFFSPYVERKFDKSSIWYDPVRTEDSALLEGPTTTTDMPDNKRKLAFILCRLFTSPAGTISTSTTGLSNVHNIFKNLMIKSAEEGTRCIDVRMLAAIFFCLVRKERNVVGKFRHTKRALVFTLSMRGHEDDVYKARLSTACAEKLRTERVAILQTLVDVENDPDDRLFDSRTFFKAFLTLYLENQQSLSVLYTEYYELGRRFGLGLPEGVRTARDATLEELLLKVEKGTLPIPYKPHTSLSWRSVPLYLGHGVFSESEKFSNCAESALYYLCNCTLWDADTRKYLDVFSADGTPSLLSTHFFTGEMKGLPDYLETKKWHALIENLPSAKHSSDYGVFIDSIDESSQSVFYRCRREYQAQDGNATTAYNEVVAGLINLFKVLEVLYGREGEFVARILGGLVRNSAGQVYIEESNTALRSGVLDSPLRGIFVLMLGPEHARNFTISLANARIERAAGRYDVYGDLRITRQYPAASFSVDHTLTTKSSHTEFLVSSQAATVGDVDTGAMAVLDDRTVPLDLRYLLYRHLEPYLSDPTRFTDFRAEVESFAVDHFNLTGPMLGAGHATRHLLDNWATSALLRNTRESRMALITIEHILSSIPIDDRGTYRMFKLPVFLLRDRLKPVPCIVSLCKRSSSLLHSLRLDATVTAYYWTENLLPEIDVLLSAGFVQSGGGMRRPETMSINFRDSPGLAESIRGVFRRYMDASSRTTDPVRSLREVGPLQFSVKALRLLLKYMLAYQVIVQEKIDHGVTLTKYEYGHFVNALADVGAYTKLGSFIVGRPQACDLIGKLFAGERELADGFRLLANIKDGKLSATLDISSELGETVLHMLLVYDLQFSDSGLKERILESQKSDSARTRMLELYRKYCMQVFSYPAYLLLHDYGLGDKCHALKLAIKFSGSFLALFAKNGCTLSLGDLDGLKTSELDLLTRISCSFFKAENVESFKMNFLSVYRSLLSMDQDAWGIAACAEQEHRRVMELVNSTDEVRKLKVLVADAFDRVRSRWGVVSLGTRLAI